MAIDLAPLWDYADPAASERRLREALAGASGDDALILQTQLARTYGLRKRFDEARRLLEPMRPAVELAGPEERAAGYASRSSRRD